MAFFLVSIFTCFVYFQQGNSQNIYSSLFYIFYLDSFFRAITTSFGSICLGSLIVAIVQAARHMLHRLRATDDGLLYCLAECCLRCIEAIIEYFNEWAFIYVAIYGRICYI